MSVPSPLGDPAQATLPGMTGPQPCGRFEWERIVRRITSESRSLKLVAMTASTYADPDGTRVRPGVQLLSAECVMSEAAVKRQIARLVELGLLDLVHRGGGRGSAPSEYRLTVPSDLLDHVQLLPLAKPATRRLTQLTQMSRVGNDTPSNSAHPDELSSESCGDATQLTQMSRVGETQLIDPPVTCSDALHHPPKEETTQVRDKVSTSPAPRITPQRSGLAVERVPPPDGWRPRRPSQNGPPLDADGPPQPPSNHHANDRETTTDA